MEDSDLQSFAGHLYREPEIHPEAFVALPTFVFGHVSVARLASIWPFCSLRGDINRIEVGEGSNIQDGSVLHVADDLPCVIGKYVTVGHKAIVHACEIGDECLVGMGAIVLDGAVVGARSIIGANATVTKGSEIPPGSLVLGSPAKVHRPLTEEEQGGIRAWAEKYVLLSREYLRMSKP